FIDDAARYLALVRAKDDLQENIGSSLQVLHEKGVSHLGTMLKNDASDLGTIAKALGLSGGVNLLEMTKSKIVSPLETVYWSMVPYRLGAPPHKHKIKFRAKWCPPKEAATDPVNPSPNFLRETMIRQLAAGAGPRQFDFEVQRGTSEMSIEDSTVKWNEEEAPFVRVAKITIPEQVFDTPARNNFGESLSYTPWHALPQHRPLGAVNRIRRVVYERISKLRHELNETQRREPTAYDPEMRGISDWTHDTATV